MDEIAALRERLALLEKVADEIVGSAVAGTPMPPPRPRFTRSQIRDVRFFEANRDAIMEAARRGEILNDVSAGRGKEPVR